MAKINMVCPFSKKMCRDCPIYRGRHYFLCFSEEYRGHIDQANGNTRAKIRQPAGEDLSLDKLTKLTSHRYTGEHQLNLKLKVVDTDNNSTEICDPEEAKTWDYNSRATMIIIAGRHITSWEHLIDVLSSKTYNGYQEVEVLKLPRL